jgi:hypothetical protein
MNETHSATSRHSADVRMALCVNGEVLPISQLGPDFLILKSPTEHGPTRAEIIMSIDGQEKRWRVHLVEGIAPTTRKTKIAL